MDITNVKKISWIIDKNSNAIDTMAKIAPAITNNTFPNSYTFAMGDVFTTSSQGYWENTINRTGMHAFIAACRAKTDGEVGVVTVKWTVEYNE